MKDLSAYSNCPVCLPKLSYKMYFFSVKAMVNNTEQVADISLAHKINIVYFMPHNLNENSKISNFIMKQKKCDNIFETFP